MRLGMVAYFRGVEPQDGKRGGRARGALHDHVLLVVPAGARLDVDAVWRAALAAGFGCVLDLEPLDSRQKAARYVSKYVTKAADQRALVPWLREHIDCATGEITERTHATYRTWSSSRTWSCRMADVVAAARLAYSSSASLEGADDDQDLADWATIRGLSPPG